MADDTKKIKRKLFDRLKEFYPDKDFVGGVISNTKHDADRQKIIEYIDKGNDISVENIILLSLHLKNERNKLEKHFGNNHLINNSDII
ncbi:MAG: hypothetical protein SO445_07070 [Lachnospiraceae bacterium]|nr:hypothetical protein [Lachnospiraceae bacterium]MDD7379023.1 hypothetical protein [Lachnospiraceae bacterium]MDY4617460.1 hypothetical protein [Lachnospiraceae bacterium]